MQNAQTREQRRAQRQSEREFAVMLVLPNGNPTVETIVDIDAARAAKAARVRAGDRGVKLVSVCSVQLVLGDCEGCKTPILQGTCFTQKASGETFCEACAR